MFKTFGKLLSLFLLLLISFMYTDKVFCEVKESNPVMKEIINYKSKNDIKAKNAEIIGDEITIGQNGISINSYKSYDNMKKDKKFNKDKIVYTESSPKISINDTYDYYITRGNTNKKYVSIIFKIDDKDDLDYILNLNNSIKLNIFIDGKLIEEDISIIKDLVKLDYEVYNLGYNGKYCSKKIGLTNNTLEAVTNYKSMYCLNEEKNNNYLKICKKNKMLSISPKYVNSSIEEIKNNLSNGMIIVYDPNEFNNNVNILSKAVTSRGYEIVKLSDLITEER